MTRIDKVKEYFENEKMLHVEFESLQEVLRHERNRAEHIRPGSSKSAVFKAFEKTVGKLIAKDRDELQKRRFLIDQIEDERIRTAMNLRYIEGKTVEEVADEMFYSIPSVFNFQKRGLAIIADQLGLKDD